MKVTGLARSEGVEVSRAASLLPRETAGRAKPFSAVLTETKTQSLLGGVINPQSFNELRVMQRRILQSASISPQELILYQVKAAHFGLGVELVSKVAESVSTSIRKFHNNP